MSSHGGRGGQKFPILLSKKTTKRVGRDQKLPIFRQHSLLTAPYCLGMDCMAAARNAYIHIQMKVPFKRIFQYVELNSGICPSLSHVGIRMNVYASRERNMHSYVEIFSSDATNPRSSPI